MNTNFCPVISGAVPPLLLSLSEKLRTDYKPFAVAYIIVMLLLAACMVLWKPRVKTKYRFIRLSAGNLLIHLMDGLATFINTPTLTWEGNPLVSKLGFGWGALFTANFIGFILITLAAWYFNRYEHVRIPSTGVFDYYMKLLYGENYKRSWFWYKFSKNYRAELALICHATYWGLTAGSPVFVIGWLLIMLGCRPSWWNDVPIALVLGTIVAFVGVYHWARKGYHKQY